MIYPLFILGVCLTGALAIGASHYKGPEALGITTTNLLTAVLGCLAVVGHALDSGTRTLDIMACAGFILSGCLGAFYVSGAVLRTVYAVLVLCAACRLAFTVGLLR